MSSVASFHFEELKEGQEFAFDVVIRPEDIDRYAQVSGDVSPLHMDAGFAKERGFLGRVAHGGLLAAYISRMVGVYCPGQNALLLTMDLKFLKPIYAGNNIRVRAVVDQVSPATRVIVLKVYIEDSQTRQAHARGKVQVGFTSVIGS